ncbi:MAG: hypothetical protein ACYSUV_15900 [Planctomycetota bacterium]|jgi:hypothetical protein
MAEIKRVLAILKARWPEVALIIGLNVLCLLVNKLHLMAEPEGNTIESVMGLAYLLILAIIILTIMLLTVGLQRTVYLEGQKRQSPLVLLRVGRYFFWRIIKLELVFVPAVWILAWLTFLATKEVTSIETDFLKSAEVAPLVYGLSFAAASLVLVKPLLLMFPLMVVVDCPVFASFKLLRQCKLLDAKDLVMLFLMSTTLMLLRGFLPSIKSASTIPEGLLIIAWHIVRGFLNLVMAVLAVRFAASLDLVYKRR